MSYLIKTYFNVYEDSYENGEGKHVNSWAWESKHDTIESALEQHFAQLGLSYDPDYMLEDDGNRHYSWTVDADNDEATQDQIEYWKQGKMQLYSLHASIDIYKMERI